MNEDMNIGQKVKTCFHIGELCFAMPNEEVVRLETLLVERKKLQGKMFGAMLNAKTGRTADAVRQELKANGQQIASVFAHTEGDSEGDTPAWRG